MNKAIVILCLIFWSSFSFSQEKEEKENDTLSVQNEQLLKKCFENIDKASDRDVKIYY